MHWGLFSSFREPLHGDLYVDLEPKPIEDRHQPADRKATQLGITDAREVCMVDAGSLLSLACRKPIVVQDGNNLRGEERFGLLDVCAWVAAVAEHVAATAHQLKIVLAVSPCCDSFFDRVRRSRIRSRSFRNVLMPCFAFSWKACHTQISSPSCTA